ncbi:hypothetical protein QWZ10_19830 [Paracoccus cavernae]|uniref:Helix-turn-helix domain-containing protein n=1 Tax=Paracoccus cavernae TaxID=1571207 RepID=A0ABT8D9G0_9RHOB|nr:hypothetical protein [Paracoccus cavernae]
MKQSLLKSEHSHHRIPRAQTSRLNPFDGRGRSVADRRRNHGAVGRLEPEDFRRRWSLLLISNFATRELCAVHFGVTFQTSCNWFDGLRTPTGDVVDFAAHSLPNYAAVMWGK